MAALLVATLHLLAFAHGVSGAESDWGRSSLYRAVFPAGNAGVDLFFVISGSVMYMVLQGRDARMGRIEGGFAFILNRVTRIYPLYWVSLAALVLFTTATLPINSIDLVRAIFLTEFTSPHEVSWTLVYEVHFYAIVAATILVFGRHAAASLLVLAMVALGLIASRANSIFLNVLMAEFAFGILATAAVQASGGRGALLAIAIGTTGCVLGGSHVTPENLVESRVVFLGAPISVVVYGLVGLELRQMLRLPRLLVAGGDVSYSIYLWHLPLARVLIAQFSPRGIGAAVCFFVLSWIVLVPLSILSYRFLEAPLTMRRLRARLRSDGQGLLRQSHECVATRPWRGVLRRSAEDLARRDTEFNK